MDECAVATPAERRNMISAVHEMVRDGDLRVDDTISFDDPLRFIQEPGGVCVYVSIFIPNFYTEDNT